MLPDRVDRAEHRKAHQQQNLREAEAVQTTLGEALNEGIGADRAIHYLLAGAIKPPVYAVMQFFLKAKHSDPDRPSHWREISASDNYS